MTRVRKGVSSANNWLKVFRHRFGLNTPVEINSNTNFRPNESHKGPREPPVMCWNLIDEKSASKCAGNLKSDEKCLEGRI